MGEFELIERYFSSAFDNSLDLGRGRDDAAVLQTPNGFQQAISVDTFIENRHFPEDMAPIDIGHRALAVAASDLAAMGAKPHWFTLALTLPVIDEPWLAGFSAGMAQLAASLGMQLVGGDTTKGPLAVSVQVAGLLPVGQQLLRSGAKVGDKVLVSGNLGDAAGGLREWGKIIHSEYLRERFCKPVPRFDLVDQLLAHATACVDISDGLLADAGHICRLSNVGMHLDADKLPLSEALQGSFNADEALAFAAAGGDDYELCFTAANNMAKSFEQLGCHIIGDVVNGEAAVLNRNGKPVDIQTKGFQHF